ncbi:hypothetical protein J6590_056519 [Homalodisca vitripennis]|nr:hypothetical protein J6590_056519 [Homalodisca vitripennis]
MVACARGRQGSARGPLHAKQTAKESGEMESSLKSFTRGVGVHEWMCDKLVYGTSLPSLFGEPSVDSAAWQTTLRNKGCTAPHSSGGDTLPRTVALTAFTTLQHWTNDKAV